MSFFSSKLFRYGIPFFLLTIGGSFALKEFTDLRYTYRQRKSYYDAIEKAGIKLKKPEEVTIESEYEKIKKIDIENWENVRIPRPWDESLDGK